MRSNNVKVVMYLDDGLGGSSLKSDVLESDFLSVMSYKRLDFCWLMRNVSSFCLKTGV